MREGVSAGGAASLIRARLRHPPWGEPTPNKRRVEKTEEGGGKKDKQQSRQAKRPAWKSSDTTGSPRFEDN